MSVRNDFRRIAAATAFALALTLGGTAASAQPMGGPHGHGGYGGAEQMIGHLIARAKTQLNLNTMQQSMFDAAVANGKTAREAARTLHQQVRSALQAELAKPEPDLAAVAKIADGVEEQARSLRQPVRNQWLQLYATFTAEQKAVVRDMLQTRMAHAESFRQKMRERMRDHFGVTGG